MTESMSFDRSDGAWSLIHLNSNVAQIYGVNNLLTRGEQLTGFRCKEHVGCARLDADGQRLFVSRICGRTPTTQLVFATADRRADVRSKRYGQRDTVHRQQFHRRYECRDFG